MTDAAATGRTRVLLVTGDRLGPAMAGPAIRAVEIGRVLAREFDVTVATLEGGRLDDVPFATVEADEQVLREVVARTDVLVMQGYLLERHPWIGQTDVRLVADAYDPFHLETLEWERHSPPEVRWGNLRTSVRALQRQLERADLVLCASEKQRDLWLGQLAGLGRVNPATYDEDETLRALLDVVPFGLPAEPPVPTRRCVRGVVPGIGDDDQVLLWGGGVYNWFDPLTLVRAVHELAPAFPRLRLVFMGMKHPVEGIPEMRMAVRLRQLGSELDLVGRHVFFNEQWVPYAERQNFLLEADVGVSCHLDHVETAYSFRTRILDYLWAGLPVVCTSGDSFAPLVEDAGAGIAVPPGDVGALAAALARLLQDDALRKSASEASRGLARGFTWERVAEPLAAFCRAPRRAPDAGLRVDGGLGVDAGLGVGAGLSTEAVAGVAGPSEAAPAAGAWSSRVADVLERVAGVLRREGARGVWSRVWSRLRSRVAAAAGTPARRRT